ncbi:MAG: C40 family peptidase [Armatimonadetes bacterium]|nr:C40 family peptidase [Armatimonadota bacterium]
MTFLRVSRSISFALALLTLGFAVPLTASAKPTKAPKSRKATVRAETVRLRAAPGKKAPLKGLLDGGRVARVLEKRNGWAKLKLESGTTGWVRADLLAINKKKTKDSGAFARQHPVAPPRRTRRAKPETVIAKRTPTRKSPRTVAAKKPSMRPMIVAKAKPQPVIKPRTFVRAQTVAPAPVRIARVTRPVITPRVVPVLRTVPVPEITPETLPETQIEATPAYETATLREGIGSQTLAEIPANTPVVTLPTPTEAVPAEATPDTTTVPTETIVATAPIPRAKPIKGKVAPAVRVPIERATKRGDRIVTRALTYRGVPYRMGATGRGAFDCSSFTRYILRMSGENLPRTAAEQYRKGTPVDKSAMRAGDLVFFKNTYKRGVSHVGIYMGAGKFIHASSSGGVKTSNLGDSYYVNHWAGARRPDITQKFE